MNFPPNDKIIIFVGDVSTESFDQAKKYSENPTLITKKNYNKIDNGVYCLSLGDVSEEIFLFALKKADLIYYVQPNEWSSSTIKASTEFLLHSLFDSKNIIGLTPSTKIKSKFLELTEYRKTDFKQLWVVGCSISHGIGVTNDEKYGQLISNELNLPCSFLTRGGSSIEWAADQILRSDIRENDIVVWGLTSESRTPFFHDDKIYHLNNTFFQHVGEHSELKKIKSIDYLLSEDLLYRNLKSIHQVLNYCEKNGIKLYIGGIIIGEEFSKYVFDLSNYISLYTPNYFLDFGTDGVHPGPKTHRWYAEKLLEKILNDQ